MKTKLLFILIPILTIFISHKSLSQQADCNNLFLDVDTFYISNQQPIVTGNINYLDTNWTVYPVLNLILADTTIITSPDMNVLSFLVYPMDTMEQFTFNINFKTSNYPNNTIVNGLFHIYDSDIPGDSIVTCYFPITLILLNSTGVDEIDNDDIQVYPNPGDNNFVIDLNKSEANVEVLVFNAIGEEVPYQKIQNTSKINLEIDSPAGIYFIRIQTKSGAVVHKIVKQ